MKQELMRWLPQNHRLALGEAGLLATAACFALLQMWPTAAPPAEAAPAASPPSLHRPLEAPELEALTSRFPAEPLAAVHRVTLVSEIGTLLQELDLHLESRRLLPLPSTPGGLRQRLELTIRGHADAHARLLGKILRGERPLAVVGLHWSAGKGADGRLLVLVLEMPIVATP